MNSAVDPPRQNASNGPRPGNRAAGWSIVVGLLGLAAIPIGVGITESRNELRLVHAGFAIPVAAVFGIVAVLLARSGRLRAERTLGRSGGERAARVGRILGWLALYVALIGAISLGVYALEYFVLS